MRLLWLPDVLRAAEVPVRVLPGWSTQGRPLGQVKGVVLHDTVTPAATWSNERVDALLRDGRTDLNGPLAQLGIDFDGVWVVVASGGAHHNGYGEWGNDSLGVEVYAAGGLKGREAPWTPLQQERAAEGTAAILKHLGYGQNLARGHKETDRGRKIDPWGIDMHEFRSRVGRLLVRAPEETDMKVGHQDRGQVTVAQWRINEFLHKEADPRGAGKDYGLLIDGDFGPATEAYVREVQNRIGFIPTGVYDPYTALRLREILDRR